MILEYFYKTGEYTIDRGYGEEWDGDDGYDFEFEIDDDQIKKALVSVIKQKVKSMLRMKSDLADKYPISKDLKEFVNGKFTKGENEFINEVINEMLSTIEDSDNLEDFAEWYREEISDYYEDEAMETQGVW